MTRLAPPATMLPGAVATLLSQVFSSGSTILLIVAVSRGDNAVEVGRVAIAALAFQVALGCTR